MPASPFSPEINRIRAVLRRHHGPDLLAVLRREIERLPIAVLVADNSQRYIAANAAACELTGYTKDELVRLTVLDLTPIPESEDSGALWETFVGQGTQRGEYQLVPKGGVTRPVRYWAFASVAPGIHVSLLVPAE